MYPILSPVEIRDKTKNLYFEGNDRFKQVKPPPYAKYEPVAGYFNTNELHKTQTAAKNSTEKRVVADSVGKLKLSAKL